MLSRDYPESAPEADIIRQSGATVMYPTADTTITELTAELDRILRRLCRATKCTPPTADAIACHLVAQLADIRQGAAPVTPPHCDLRRAQRLRRRLRDSGLVCGLADHGHGQLYVICPRRLDRLVPTVFDPHDSDKFAICNDPPDDLLARSASFAETWVHLAPVLRQQPSLASWTVSVKAKYPDDSPKYMMRLRPISNYSRQPAAPLLSLVAKCLMWLVRMASERGAMPWVITRTIDLVPALTGMLTRATSAFGGTTGLIWRRGSGDCEGFF